MKKYFLLLTMALVGAGSFTACSSDDDDDPQLPGETKEYYVDATTSGMWNYFSFATGTLVGSATESAENNAIWFARKDWDIAINRYNIRTNSGLATTAGALGGVYTYAESVSFNSVSSVPAGISYVVDKSITSSGMSGETTVIRSEDATVILFKKNEDGSSVMPPVYLQAPVYIFRTADGASYYKVQFTQYKDENNATGHVKFNAAQIYQQ